jgi:rod shape-determining protein MreC
MSKLKTVASKIVIFIAVIIALILLHYVKVMQPLEGALTFFIKPAQAQLYKFGLLITDYDFLKEKTDLINENDNLKAEKEKLAVQNSNLQNLLAENRILQEQIDFLSQNNYRSEPTKIISKYNDENAQIITLNQGKNKKIEVGYAVIAKDGILIGKIINVYSNTSEALLITSNNTKVAAQIQNENNTPGLVVGQHGLSLAMELIPKDDQIEADNLVITSGAESSVPNGLLIGKIESISNNAGDLFSQAKIIPLLDYNNLNIVSVIIP